MRPPVIIYQQPGGMTGWVVVWLIVIISILLFITDPALLGHLGKTVLKLFEAIVRIATSEQMPNPPIEGDHSKQGSGERGLEGIKPEPPRDRLEKGATLGKQSEAIPLSANRRLSANPASGGNRKGKWHPKR